MYAHSRGSHPKYEDGCAARTLRCGYTGAAGTRMKNRGDVETAEEGILQDGTDEAGLEGKHVCARSLVWGQHFKLFEREPKKGREAYGGATSGGALSRMRPSAIRIGKQKGAPTKHSKQDCEADHTCRKDGHRFIYISGTGTIVAHSMWKKRYATRAEEDSHGCSSKRCDSGSWKRSGPITKGIDERRGESPYEVDVQEQVRTIQGTARGDSRKVKASVELSQGGYKDN
ncbi:hypothetical protein B0H14DRAFT_3573584 [Mycena olivaceomarginata]|nr:hypothetical protein B0H14DRAFT_3573584 [Mycena olivaceomarginata]